MKAPARHSAWYKGRCLLEVLLAQVSLLRGEIQGRQEVGGSRGKVRSLSHSLVHLYYGKLVLICSI